MLLGSVSGGPPLQACLPAEAQCTTMQFASLVGVIRSSTQSLHAGLLTLELVRTSFSRVPPALSTATSLRELSLTDNPQLVLSIEDVQSVLMRLPRLQHLYLDVERTQEHVSALLAHAMPQLQIHDGHAPWD